MQGLDLGAHLHTQLSIEIGQRLVEQKDLRIADDSPPHRHSLPLPTRKLPRITIEIVGQIQNLRSRRTFRLISALSTLASCKLKAMLSKTFICG